jgi:hypothetical protein
MKLDLEFDEQKLTKAVVDQVVQAVKDEFHKLFPRLRREDFDGNPNMRYGEAISPAPKDPYSTGGVAFTTERTIPLQEEKPNSGVVVVTTPVQPSWTLCNNESVSVDERDHPVRCQ